VILNRAQGAGYADRNRHPVRVCRAAQEAQQGDVKRLGNLAFGQAHAFGQLDGDQAGSG
jgi:hypothetical protein